MGRQREHAVRFLRERGVLVLLPLLLLGGSAPASARTTIVPDDFPTIQAAIDYIRDSYVADTILVRPGEYPEVIEVRDNLVIRGMGTTPGAEPVSKVAGLRALMHSELEYQGQRYEGLHFMGPVSIGYRINGVFLDCRFDSDLATDFLDGNPDATIIVVRRCDISGSTSLLAEELYLDSSTFHGPVWLSGWLRASVTDSRIEQTRGTALTVYTREGEANILRNEIVGGTDGIFVTTHEGVHVSDNRITGCFGQGIRAEASSGGVFAERNTVSRCHIGIRAVGLQVARGNRVFDCSSTGLSLSLGRDPVIVEQNVVGRCQGSGLVVSNALEQWNVFVTVDANTAFACSGAAGLLLEDLVQGTVSRNLSCFNGVGLVITSADPLELSCNNWYGNAGGDTSDGAPGPTDLSIDPRLCDGVNGDGSLLSDSPLLDAPGCGPIGALGVGCEPPPVAIGLELRQDVLPLPARGGWVTAWLEPRSPFVATDVEIASVRLNGVPVASTDGVIGDHDRDGIADLQLRFDRVAVGRTLGHADVETVTVTGSMRGRRFVGSDEIRVPRLHGVGRPPAPDPESADPVLTIHAPIFNGASGGLRVAFTLVDASPARLELLDVAGRVVISRDVQWSGSGEHAVDLADGGHLAQGIYFLRIRQGASEARTRAAIVR